MLSFLSRKSLSHRHPIRGKMDPQKLLNVPLQLQLLHTKLPMGDMELHHEVKALKRHMRERYDDEALGDEAMRVQYWAELKSATHADNEKIYLKNEEVASGQVLTKVFQGDRDEWRSERGMLAVTLSAAGGGVHFAANFGW